VDTYAERLHPVWSFLQTRLSPATKGEIARHNVHPAGPEASFSAADRVSQPAHLAGFTKSHFNNYTKKMGKSPIKRAGAWLRAEP
jgi:hypothetical protein